MDVDATYLYTSLYRRGQSATLPYRHRMWIRSKWLSGNVQSKQQSSISNLQFGGRNSGWIGERSMPVTSAAGYSSARSLMSWG